MQIGDYRDVLTDGKNEWWCPTKLLFMNPLLKIVLEIYFFIPSSKKDCKDSIYSDRLYKENSCFFKPNLRA